MRKRKQENTLKKTKTYKLLDYRIKVHYVDKDEIEGRWVFGHAHFNANDVNIYISTKNESGKQLSEGEMDTTLRHELFHAILGKLYFNDEEQNETLIEWLAQSASILHKQGLTI